LRNILGKWERQRKRREAPAVDYLFIIVVLKCPGQVVDGEEDWRESKMGGQDRILIGVG
jgi:hypothetical protein